MMDVRKPIGFLFSIFGLLLTLYAVLDPQITTLELVGSASDKLILNLNLPCGLSMFIFGILMLLFSYLKGSSEAGLRSQKAEQAKDLLSASLDKD